MTNGVEVTYQHGTEERLWQNGSKWFYDAPWMPDGKQHTITATRMGFEMMVNEKEEGPSLSGKGDNARRFYHKVVTEELV